MTNAGDEHLFEWGLNTNSGQIEETTRTAEGKERVVDRVVNPDTLKMADDPLHIKLPSRQAAPVAETQEAASSDSNEAVAVVPVTDNLTTEAETKAEDIPMTTAD